MDAYAHGQRAAAFEKIERMVREIRDEIGWMKVEAEDNGYCEEMDKIVYASIRGQLAAIKDLAHDMRTKAQNDAYKEDA